MKRLARVALAGVVGFAVTCGMVTPAGAAPAQAPAAAAAAKLSGPVKPGFTTLRLGMKGEAVRQAQAKLVAIGYLTRADGVYGTGTRDAVKRLQTAYKHSVINGEINAATMATLNVLYDRAIKVPAGTLSPGMTGEAVRQLQTALATIGYYTGSVNGTYNNATKTAVANVQRTYKVSGLRGYATPVTRTTINTIYKKVLANQRVKLHANCMTGRAICVDKTARKLYWVVNGRVQKTLDARFARPGFSTPTGNYRVYTKIYKDWSRAYRAWMPFSIYYQGGRAVHYSYGFASDGYNGGSAGCVNLRDWNGAAWLYNQVRVGDKVIIFNS